MALCTKCHKRESISGRKRCSHCTNLSRAYIQRQSANHKCHRCNKDADHYYCESCSSIYNKRFRDYKDTHPEIVKERDTKRHMKKYYDYASLGICIKCHTNPAESSKSMCRSCLDRKANYQKEYRRRKDMQKVNESICNKCKYSGIKGTCSYLIVTGKRRNCPVGYCDKYEKGNKEDRRRELF